MRPASGTPEDAGEPRERGHLLGAAMRPASGTPEDLQLPGVRVVDRRAAMRPASGTPEDAKRFAEGLDIIAPQ